MNTPPVILEVRALSQAPTGVARYVAGLLSGLQSIAPDLPLLLVGDGRRLIAPPNLPRVMVPPHQSFLRLYRDVWSLPRALRRIPGRLIHLTKPNGMLWGRRLPPVVMTIFDLIPLTHPETQTFAQRTYWRTQLPLAARCARHIFTISEASKSSLVEQLQVDPERITVTYPGVDRRFSPASAEEVSALKHRFRIPGPYLLSVGTIEPRKGIDRLLRAFARISQEVPHRLVVAGRWGWKTGPVRAAAADARLKGRVRFLGPVSDEELVALYSGADASVFLSVAEGFGFPPLESMACGTPVVVGNRSCLPEITGPAARLVDPLDQEDIVSGLSDLLAHADQGAERRASGASWVQRFRWEETARRTLEVYHRFGA